MPLQRHFQESEFIVVDDDHLHETKETVKRLKEVIDMYNNAHGALIKSNILLQDQLQLALQLVLQRVPPDTESSVEELVKSEPQSLYACTDAVRRDYVKSLCSKLVVVNAEYQKLTQELETFKLNGVSDTWFKPKMERLRTALQDMEATLSSPEQSPVTVTGLEKIAKPADDELGELCALAERINSGLKARLNGKPRIEHRNTGSDPILLPTADRQTVTSRKQEIPAAGMSQQAIVKVIQEEVSNVMQKEMQRALQAHGDLIRGTLAVETAVTPGTGPASRLPSTDQGPTQSCSGASTSVSRVTVPSPVKPNAPELGSEAVPKTANNAPPPPPAEPTYTPEQEAPECPACGLKCEHRLHLEAHLETCLSSPH
ncbi:hypothetical protein AAHC03_026488 [Spirometra sp. Aus1]